MTGKVNVKWIIPKFADCIKLELKVEFGPFLYVSGKLPVYQHFNKSDAPKYAQYSENKRV